MIRTYDKNGVRSCNHASAELQGLTPVVPCVGRNLRLLKSTDAVGEWLGVAQNRRQKFSRKNRGLVQSSLCMIARPDPVCVARTDVPLYREPVDGTTDMIYLVKQGEVCNFGREVVNKVFLFKEVKCGEAVGWTADWMEFKEID